MRIWPWSGHLPPVAASCDPCHCLAGPCPPQSRQAGSCAYWFAYLQCAQQSWEVEGKSHGGQKQCCWEADAAFMMSVTLITRFQGSTCSESLLPSRSHVLHTYAAWCVQQASRQLHAAEAATLLHKPCNTCAKQECVMKRLLMPCDIGDCAYQQTPCAIAPSRLTLTSFAWTTSASSITLLNNYLLHLG